MKNILIGPIMDGNAGGIDRYILNLYERTNCDEIRFDFFTNQISDALQKTLAAQNSNLFEIADLKHPFRQYADFKRLFRTRKYDTAYFNFSTALGLLGPMAAKKCGVPKIVIHSHTTDCDIANPYKRKLMTFLHAVCRKILYRFGTEFYACSKEAGLWMFPCAIVEGGQFSVVKNAIQLERFVFNAEIRAKVRKELQLEDAYVVGHIGNFVYQKNHSFLLQSFQKLCDSVPNAKLLLVGDGPLYQAVQDSAAQMGLKDGILFLGRKTNANDYLQAMDVFAFPSNFEGLGIVAVEAQAAGLPCVCSDRVPSEAAVTEQCCFLPIDTADSVQLWADKLMALQGVVRKDMSDVITASGYNIRQQDFQHLV